MKTRRMTHGEHLPLQMVHDSEPLKPKKLTLADLNRLFALMFRPPKEK